LFAAKEATGLWAAAGLPDLHFTYMATVMFAVTLVLCAAISAARPAAGGDPAMTFRAADARPEAKSPRRLTDYRAQAAGLALLMAGLILAFW
jgi:SSS family solute:Na+ symporter